MKEYFGNTFPPYIVDLWSSNPEEDASCDNQVAFKEFLTKTFAIDCFEHPENYFSPLELKRAVFIAFDWDEVFCSRRLISEEEVARRNRIEKENEKREFATEAGMLGGCEAYNEAMGCDCHPSEEYDEE